MVGRSGRKLGQECSRCKWPRQFLDWRLRSRWGRGRTCSSSSCQCKRPLWGGTGGLECLGLGSPIAGLEWALLGREAHRRRRPELGGAREMDRQEIRSRNLSVD